MRSGGFNYILSFHKFLTPGSLTGYHVRIFQFEPNSLTVKAFLSQARESGFIRLEIAVTTSALTRKEHLPLK